MIRLYPTPDPIVKSIPALDFLSASEYSGTISTTAQKGFTAMGHTEQAQRLYNAENQLVTTLQLAAQEKSPTVIIPHLGEMNTPVIRDFANDLRVGGRLGLIGVLRHYVADIARSETIIDQFGTDTHHGLNFVIHPTLMRRATYTYEDMTITLPGANIAWALSELVILHEVAHHLTHLAAPASCEDAHGAKFIDTYLTLLGEVISPEMKLMQTVIFHEHGAL